MPAEGDLGDLLPGAEAVVDRATGQALLPQAIVNGAAEVRSQVRAGLPGVLVDREVRRGGERGHDAVQPEAARAVGPQVKAPTHECSDISSHSVAPAGQGALLTRGVPSAGAGLRSGG